MNYDSYYEQQMSEAEGQAMAEQSAQFDEYLDSLVKEKQYALLAFEIVLDHLTGFDCNEEDKRLFLHITALRDKFKNANPTSITVDNSEIPF